MLNKKTNAKPPKDSKPQSRAAAPKTAELKSNYQPLEDPSNKAALDMLMEARSFGAEHLLELDDNMTLIWRCIAFSRTWRKDISSDQRFKLYMFIQDLHSLAEMSSVHAIKLGEFLNGEKKNRS